MMIIINIYLLFTTYSTSIYYSLLIQHLSTIHYLFNTGKPTTFATFKRPDNSRSGSTLFFGLPGNPVSCLVTKALFVDTAVKRMQGLESDACLHPQLTVQLAGASILLDPERPEYHRAALVPTIMTTTGHNSSVIHAYSTGNQRSSRLQSMLTANALLFLPQGPGVVEVGTTLQALLIRPLIAATRGISIHPSAANLDYTDDAEEEELDHDVHNTVVATAATIGSPSTTTTASAATTITGGSDQYVSFPRTAIVASAIAASASTAAASTAATAVVVKDGKHITVGLLTISDRVRTALINLTATAFHHYDYYLLLQLLLLLLLPLLLLPLLLLLLLLLHLLLPLLLLMQQLNYYDIYLDK